MMRHFGTGKRHGLPYLQMPICGIELYLLIHLQAPTSVSFKYWLQNKENMTR